MYLEQAVHQQQKQIVKEQNTVAKCTWNIKPLVKNVPTPTDI